MISEIKANDIAKYFLTKSSLTPKKIQKLVYYAYSWFIALNNESADKIENVLFDEQPEAWIHGPVFRSLYDIYKPYNWQAVPKVKENIQFKNNDIAPLLDDVYAKYGIYSADQLEYLTHNEDPWKNARKNTNALEISNNKIGLRDIFLYYNSLIKND